MRDGVRDGDGARVDSLSRVRRVGQNQLACIGANEPGGGQDEPGLRRDSGKLDQEHTAQTLSNERQQNSATEAARRWRVEVREHQHGGKHNRHKPQGTANNRKRSHAATHRWRRR